MFSPRVGLTHPSFHLYNADELKDLFADCSVLEMAASNAVLAESPLDAGLEGSWDELVALERIVSVAPGMLDVGSHIIGVFRTPS